MGTLILEDFKIGLDRRRMNETSLPGSLVICNNAHVTRGGEIEKSEAFVRFCDLPANTFGLKSVGNGFVVFGSDNITPTLLKSNPPVKYQRLFDAGGIQSFGSFTISGQVAADTFTSIKAGAIELLSATTTCSATPANWPAEIAAAITAFSGTSGYKAFAVGNKITIYAVAVGTASNGFAITTIKTGTVTVASSVNFSGGLAATNPSMVDVLSVDLYNGLPYVIADYSDGIIRHWYDGVKVADMYSAKARAQFSIAATPSAVQAVSAEGSFTIISPAVNDTITSITVGAIQLLAATVTFSDAATSFESSVVEAINENSNISGFSAILQAGRKVVITSEIAGAGPNGLAVAVIKTGAMTIQDLTALAGGVNAKQITSITINAVEILPIDVDWAESSQQTAAAVAAAIKDYSATSGFEAFSIGSKVIIRAIADGAATNGQAFAVVADAGITISGASTVIGGGAGLLTIIEPGRFNKTFKNKMYNLVGGSVYFSALGEPSNFTSGIGFGFSNLSTNSSGSETLTALANYFSNLAVFSRDTIQVWFFSDNPLEIQQIQVLNNTGTLAPESVVEFGDNDVFYLSESGVRSLRARDSTNAAFVNDVGIAIDPIIQKELLENNIEAERAKGILEPRQGRFLLVIGETVYVFSFFPSSKISAWSTYTPGFSIENIQSVGQTIVCRSSNALYKIGSSTQRVYDSRQVKVVTPFLAGDDPTVLKTWTGIDLACEGTWDIYAAFDPLRVDEDGLPDETLYEKISSVTGTTYNESGGSNGNIWFDGSSSHISLMFVCRSDGYARIGNVAIHYADGGEKG